MLSFFSYQGGKKLSSVANNDFKLCRQCFVNFVETFTHRSQSYLIYSSIDYSQNLQSSFAIKSWARIFSHTSEEESFLFFLGKAFSHAICSEIPRKRKRILNYEFIYSTSEIIKTFVQLVSIFFALERFNNVHSPFHSKISRETTGKLHAPMDNGGLLLLVSKGYESRQQFSRS